MGPISSYYWGYPVLVGTLKRLVRLHHYSFPELGPGLRVGVGTSEVALEPFLVGSGSPCGALATIADMFSIR
eukprot:IDg3008t1